MALKSAAIFEKKDPFIKTQGADLVKELVQSISLKYIPIFAVLQKTVKTIVSKIKVIIQNYGQFILKMEMDLSLMAECELLMPHSQQLMMI
ncbi:unnamed protein product (macronuclear) [Paramecium tetraurelia]|uniref:Uncharacterized protein n=1 Tax=Paramecium tetraurelia TaxID=5888 RepID=A0DMS7_PARTE|nr:uncharacterized protein GSPATT00018548001 [Paramecium tetraurelia]CAK84344.1 unnamed protein product [Paramecium tetraurelia]|eukprot:XP_001451741.1 hypothetical protein (macronuclear) [Paramecium tetraurelia strain d4-2]